MRVDVETTTKSVTFLNVKGFGIAQGSGFFVLSNFEDAMLAQFNPMHVISLTFPEADNLVKPATGVSLA